jgi:hypothetical protein
VTHTSGVRFETRHRRSTEAEIHFARRRPGSCFRLSDVQADAGGANGPACARLCLGVEKIEIVISREKLGRVLE